MVRSGSWPTCSASSPKATPGWTHWSYRGATRPAPRPGRDGAAPVERIVPDETALPGHVAGEGVFTLPYGPVRSGVFESVQYLVETPGEDIPHLRARVYHKHRGLERRFQGMSPADGVLLAERVEGVASVAHALAFCQAVETLSPAASRWPARARAVAAVPEGALWCGRCTPSWNAGQPSRLHHPPYRGRRPGGGLRPADLAQRTANAPARPSCAGTASAGRRRPGGVSGRSGAGPGRRPPRRWPPWRRTYVPMPTSHGHLIVPGPLRGTGVITPDGRRPRGALGPVGRASGFPRRT